MPPIPRVGRAASAGGPAVAGLQQRADAAIKHPGRQPRRDHSKVAGASAAAPNVGCRRLGHQQRRERPLPGASVSASQAAARRAPPAAGPRSRHRRAWFAKRLRGCHLLTQQTSATPIRSVSRAMHVLACDDKHACSLETNRPSRGSTQSPSYNCPTFGIIGVNWRLAVPCVRRRQQRNMFSNSFA